MPEYPICPHNNEQPVTTGAGRVVPAPAQPVPALTEQLNALVQRPAGGSRPDGTPDVSARIAALTDLPLPDLRKHWLRRFHCPAPKRLSRDLLLRGIACTMQEQVYGGLKGPVRRKLRSLLKTTLSGKQAGTGPAALLPGMRLVREWHGQRHDVLVLETGFSFRGRMYPSLTAIAKEITGTHWSGPRFFGLNRSSPRIPEPALCAVTGAPS